ncbi:MAG: LysM peptidoglycan-binding domain-containing protein [Bacteroidetes bacterium]|nr:LysM peptidoglycan-binding domain-containing protein [Bacteroidota bacterium]
MKIHLFIALISFGLSSSAFAQVLEEQESATPILATLDSLTELLHHNGFMQNAEYVQVDELDFNPGKDLPHYPATLIQDRMNSIGSEIALEYNSYVKGFIDLYGVKKKELTSKMLGLSDYYFPIYEEILDRNNLPLELKYLSVVESALNPKATSWAGASGPWQFIYSTGVRYGLTINSYIDERRDVFKSTQAACDYFKDSYALYGDWLLVIASYNCGPGNVNKAIRRAGGSKNFWAIQRFLPRETRGYVPAFIAVAYLMNFAKEHGIAPTPGDYIPLIESVEVNGLLTFEQMASALHMSVDKIYDLNPHYQKELVPDFEGGMQVYLPLQQAMLFSEIHDSIAEMPLIDELGKPYRLDLSIEKIRYKVRKGDNLYSIARKYHVSTSDIKEWNVIHRNRVVPGRYLTIHIDKKERVYLDLPEQAVLAQQVDDRGHCARFHTIKSGDTLYSISKQYEGVTVEMLKKWNNLADNSTLMPGHVLKVAEGS